MRAGAWIQAAALLALGGGLLGQPEPLAAAPRKASPPKRAVAKPARVAPTAPKAPTPAPKTAGPADPCADWIRRLPRLNPTWCRDAGLEPSGARSVSGQPLVQRDVVPAATPTLKVLVVGAVHGDELSSGTLALHWLSLALDGQEVARQLPQQAVLWRFVPVLNPDGVARRPVQRTNANGVDLNRNFPTTQWETESRRYWEQLARRDPRRWPGKQALSEPETRYLHQQIEALQPHLIVSIHAPFGILDFDSPLPPARPVQAPSRLGRLFLDQLGIFPGSLGNYAGLQLGVPVVTIELPHALELPPVAEMSGMWSDLLRWMGTHLVPGSTPDTLDWAATPAATPAEDPSARQAAPPAETIERGVRPGLLPAEPPQPANPDPSPPPPAGQPSLAPSSERPAAVAPLHPVPSPSGD